MKELIDELRATINNAEGDPKDWYYFTLSLSTAKGVLSAIDNSPKGSNEYVNKDIIKRAIWNLKNSMTNKI